MLYQCSINYLTGILQDACVDTFILVQYLQPTHKHLPVPETNMLRYLSIDTPQVFAILQDVGVDIFTLGQYLQPTPKHLPVLEMVPPEKFEYWRKYGEEVVGFR